MKTLKTLTATLALALVLAAPAIAGTTTKLKDKTELDTMTTQSVSLAAKACEETATNPTDSAVCRTEMSTARQSSRYPVNALEGLNLGF